jgi:probable rRNA maturation factor
MLQIKIHHGPPDRRPGRPTRVPRFSAAWFQARLLSAAKLAGVRRGDWSIWLIGDSDMAALHKRTMNIPTTTDVLTFDFRDPGSSRAGPLDLQTLVCVDQAQRQSLRHNKMVREELLLYMLHSLLHVSGYDDHTAKAAKKMHQREDEILTHIGIGPVFIANGRAGGARSYKKKRNSA